MPTARHSPVALVIAVVASFAVYSMIGDPCAAQPSPDDFVMSVSGATLVPDEASEVPTILDVLAGNLQGWSLGICHDPAMLEILSAWSGATTLVAKNGSSPDFNEIQVLSGGYTQGVVLCMMGCAVLPPGIGYELMVGSYAPVPGAVGTTVLCPCDTLGVPPVSVVVVVGGGSIVPVQVCGELALLPPSAPFVRGDANDDGSHDIADAIWILSDLFSGGPHTDCAGANDANDDGTMDIADALFLLAAEFAGGPAPAPPYPDCGTSGGPAECASFTSCP